MLCNLALIIALHAQTTGATYVDLTAANSTVSDEMTARLSKKGLVVKQVVHENSGRVHLRIGPYDAIKAEIVRKQMAAEGYTVTLVVPVLPINSASDVNERMRQLEAEANAKLGIVPTPTVSGDLEVQALAKLGLNTSVFAPRTQAETEAEALKAMYSNTEREAAEAETRRVAEQIAKQQTETDRLQREMDQQQAAANAPPQQSTAASFLHALNGAIAAGTDAYAQQQASNQASNQTRLDQIAALRAQQAQIEARRAAEQKRQQQAAQAIATPSVTGHPRTESSATCDDARDHLPPGSTQSAYQGCIPYKGTQSSPITSNMTNTQPSAASFTVLPQAVSPTQTPVAKPRQLATASCRNMLYSVELNSKWTDAKKTEVVGFFDNNSIGTANCVWAFHKNGRWTDYGSMNISAGKQHVGGEFGGVWSTGTDSSDIKYACYEGPDAVDAEGLSCIAQTKFIGQTMAGTDK